MTPELKMLISEFGNANFDYGEGETGDSEAEAMRVLRAKEALTTHLDSLESRVAELERNNTKLLCERDAFGGWAGMLADAIAAHFREDIGEHSSANNPWANALELIDGTFCR